MSQLEGFLRRTNKNSNDPTKKLTNKPKDPDSSLKIYTNNFFFPDYSNLYPKNLFFKPPNVPIFTTTKKFQNQLHGNQKVQSPNNFFNRLRKNHSISNIASPTHNINQIEQNTNEISGQAKQKNKNFVPFRRSSINNWNNLGSYKSLNNTAKSKQSKSTTKHSGNERNLENNQYITRIKAMVQFMQVKTKDLTQILGEMTNNDKFYTEIISTFVEKINNDFENKNNEINQLEINLREKDEKIKKLEKEKKKYQNFIPKTRPNKNEQFQDLINENLELKNKIIDQQGKIMELKKQERKFEIFLKELKEQGVDLEKNYEEKQFKKKKKLLEEKKILEKNEIISPKLMDFESISYRADESVVNESGESSFNYYGKTNIDDSFMKYKDKVQKNPKSVIKKLNTKMKLNLKAIKNTEVEIENSK